MEVDERPAAQQHERDDPERAAIGVDEDGGVLADLQLDAHLTADVAVVLELDALNPPQHPGTEVELGAEQAATKVGAERRRPLARAAHVGAGLHGELDGTGAHEHRPRPAGARRVLHREVDGGCRPAGRLLHARTSPADDRPTMELRSPDCQGPCTDGPGLPHDLGGRRWARPE